MAVIDEFRNILTVLIEFELSPDEVDEHVANIKEFVKGTVKGQPGFISANLHVSTDRKKVVNYAQWKTEEDYQNFLNNEEVQGMAKNILKITPKTTLMKVVLAS